MKIIMVMFDSLNRRMLSPYGCSWTHTPNFARLAARAVTFERAYVGSMPCMPARREIHTGRYNFLHRSWGPLEPFDDSMPQILSQHGIYTHLVSDHYHYWEDGGCTYHTRYNSWEIARGQEGDPWIGQVRDPAIPEAVAARTGGDRWRQDWINRSFMRDEKDHPQAKTFAMGLDFIRRNADAGNWFLQIETFDPHEPYFSDPKYKAHYPHDYKGPHFDWPPYDRVKESAEAVEHCRMENAALHTMCDTYLGKVLDMMDELDLWKDTMLIVNTDHGFLLGEHDWWAKCRMPFWNEVANMPLFIWDPRSGVAGQRRSALVQTIDLPATILEFFSIDRPRDMQGRPLRQTIIDDTPVRQAALYGMHGAHVNVTDGRHVYMRGPVREDNWPLFNYTVMPTHMRDRWSCQNLSQAKLAKPFSFTKEARTLKLPAHGRNAFANAHSFGTLLYDLESDPKQQTPLQDPRLEKKMIAHLIRLMRQNDAPAEQYRRLGLKASPAAKNGRPSARAKKPARAARRAKRA